MWRTLPLSDTFMGNISWASEGRLGEAAPQQGPILQTLCMLERCWQLSEEDKRKVAGGGEGYQSRSVLPLIIICLVFCVFPLSPSPQWTESQMFVVWQTESETTSEHRLAQAELRRSQNSGEGACTQTRPGPVAPQAEGKNQKTPKRSVFPSNTWGAVRHFRRLWALWFAPFVWCLLLSLQCAELLFNPRRKSLSTALWCSPHRGEKRGWEKSDWHKASLQLVRGSAGPLFRTTRLVSGWAQAGLGLIHSPCV